MTELRPVRTLLPMACDGVGPSATCINLMTAAYRAGFPGDVFANRARIAPPPVPMTLSVPRLLSSLPYKTVEPYASRRLEKMFLDRIAPDDIAYLWPSVSTEVHRVLHDRGIPVVLEGINTRMAYAKRILDTAYDDFGIPPAHGITEERIAEEEEKYHYASAIFAPNPHVERALEGSPLEDRIIPSSYGVDISKASPERSYEDKKALTFMFCGYACVRKGVHFLLDAWKRIPAPHKLQLVGRIEPAIEERYADLLASDRVECVGFVDNVHDWFAAADVFVFPSLEEGGPQVVYEAAIHGLPIIASPMGAGRLGAGGEIIVAEPQDLDALTEAMAGLLDDTEARAALGQAARRRALDFDWQKVGARRAARLQEAFGIPRSAEFTLDPRAAQSVF